MNSWESMVLEEQNRKDRHDEVLEAKTSRFPVATVIVAIPASAPLIHLIVHIASHLAGVPCL